MTQRAAHVLVARGAVERVEVGLAVLESRAEDAGDDVDIFALAARVEDGRIHALQSPAEIS